LKISENREDDILNLVIEVIDRKNGSFIEDNNDIINKKKFWKIFFDKLKYDRDFINHDGTYKAKISSSFLKNNQWFLN
jgi:hypothetical protein